MRSSEGSYRSNCIVDSHVPSRCLDLYNILPTQILIPSCIYLLSDLLSCSSSLLLISLILSKRTITMETALTNPFHRAYDSREELLSTLRDYAVSQGYAITTIRSNADRNICIGCDRGGQLRDRINAPEGSKRRRTSSNRVGCTFSVYASKSSAKHSDGKWHIKVSNPNHNHPLEDNMITHAAARSVTLEQRRTIYNLLNEGIPPRNIISVVKKDDPTLLIIPKDIYNLRQAHLRERLTGRAPVQYLKKKAPPKCSNCGEIGHTIRSCKV
jgi:hypothetical protein